MKTIPDYFHGVRVRDHIPLEQGLRLDPLVALGKCHVVRDHIPLEQGLRHYQR